MLKENIIILWSGLLPFLPLPRQKSLKLHVYSFLSYPILSLPVGVWETLVCKSNEKWRGHEGQVESCRDIFRIPWVVESHNQITQVFPIVSDIKLIIAFMFVCKIYIVLVLYAFYYLPQLSTLTEATNILILLGRSLTWTYYE